MLSPDRDLERRRPVWKALADLRQQLGGWLVPGRNPFGLYLYLEEVDELAARMGCRAEDKPWGMYEFAVSDPDETLVRVGWPSRLRTRA